MHTMYTHNCPRVDTSVTCLSALKWPIKTFRPRRCHDLRKWPRLWGYRSAPIPSLVIRPCHHAWLVSLERTCRRTYDVPASVRASPATSSCPVLSGDFRLPRERTVIMGLSDARGMLFSFSVNDSISHVDISLFALFLVHCYEGV